MTNEGYTRKLTAILSADVQGYSRLMQDDDEATITTLTGFREVMSGLIRLHRGRVVDSPGDNLLAEFASVVDAVNCAVEIQEELKVRNADLEENRRMQFRIGINVGDVIIDGERIYGDGVNIAARLEGLAEGGGICISGTVFEHIKNKLNLWNEYLGEHAVKNISEPVRVYRVHIDGVEPDSPVEAPTRATVPPWKKAALVLAIVVVTVAAALAVWNHYRQPPIPSQEARPDQPAADTVPDQPSIAVLPFDNMTDDPKQESFCDGLTEDLITGLSQFQDVSVTARNATFVYKGKAVDIKKVGDELGVQYILEGSVRQDGDRVRITAQLVDVQSGRHSWAERYDRDLKDTFALQDEITTNILAALHMELKGTKHPQTQTAHVKPDKPGPAEARPEGPPPTGSRPRPPEQRPDMKPGEGPQPFKRQDRRGIAKNRQAAEQAMADNQNDPQPYVDLAWTYIFEIRYRPGDAAPGALDQAEKLAQKALDLDASLVEPYGVLTNVYLNKREYDRAVAEGRQAVSIAPDSADAHAYLGLALHYSGRADEAVTELKKALQLSPKPPAWYSERLGMTYFLIGKYQEAIAQGKKALQADPKHMPARIVLAAGFEALGDNTAAQKVVLVIQRIPGFTTDRFRKSQTYKNPEDLERIVKALQQAGLQ